MEPPTAPDPWHDFGDKTMSRRTDCEGFYRRDFLRLGSAGLLGLSLPDLLRREAAAGTGSRTKAKSVIMVWLAGGPATIDMWDLKPDAPEGIRGEFKPISTQTPGVQISEHLPRMARLTDQYSIVRSLAHSIPSHEVATTFMTTGNKPTAALQYPSLGSLAARLMPVERGLPGFVAFGDVRGGRATQAGYLGSGYNAFLVEGAGGRGNARNPAGALSVRGISLPNNFSLESLEKRDKLLQSFDAGFEKLDKSGDLIDGLDTFHRQALDILRSDKTKKAFNLAAESAATRERYGDSPFGQGMLAARRVIEAGVRFVCVGLGGWDTHESNFQRLKERNLPVLDQALSALIGDLSERGLLESTIVYCAGEFGRTPKINNRGAGGGRDHWARSMAVVLAGGGIKGGYVHGSTDPLGMVPATDPCSPDDIAATVFHCLGIENTRELSTPNGRKVQLFREGRVIDKLLA
jgi:uncharacterized protein (DUF1501 family)